MRILLLLLFLPSVAALEWSEIMFDPEGSDNGKEYIELVGQENLSGCTITDSASSDELTLVQGGSDVILIIEEEGTFETDATIYHAGKAIGNGLGNTYEELTIACEGVLLKTTYNVSAIADFETGYSIVYNQVWRKGSLGGTPGVLENVSEEPIEEEPREKQEESIFCNTTLVITVSNTTGFVGDAVLFTIVSAANATFSAEANGSVFLEGSTRSRREYSMTLPDTDLVIISATAETCDATQRAKRRIVVLQPPPKPMPEPPVVNVTESVPEVPEKNATPPEPVREEQNTTEVVGTLYERDRNMIPWISAFGMLTLLVSAGLFVYERKSSESH